MKVARDLLIGRLTVAAYDAMARRRDADSGLRSAVLCQAMLRLLGDLTNASPGRSITKASAINRYDNLELRM